MLSAGLTHTFTVHKSSSELELLPGRFPEQKQAGEEVGGGLIQPED